MARFSVAVAAALMMAACSTPAPNDVAESVRLQDAQALEARRAALNGEPLPPVQTEREAPDSIDQIEIDEIEFLEAPSTSGSVSPEAVSVDVPVARPAAALAEESDG